MTHKGHQMRLQPRAALSATLALALLWGGFAEVQVGVLRGGSFYQSTEPGGDPTIIAPRAAVLAGPPLPLASAAALRDSPEACSQLCRDTDGCTWFEYCGEEDGCSDASGSQPLVHLGCRLLTANCTGLPTLAQQGASVQVTSGFPIDDKGYPAHMVFTELPGQGILGGDYPCPNLGSVRPGMCAFHSVDQALVLCFVLATCEAVVVYREGLDGCSSTIAVHKNASLLPSNSFASPGVFTMLGISIPTPYQYYLYENDGEVILPTPEEMAANRAAGLGAHDGNSSTPSGWWGGIIAPNALYDGVQVALFDGVEGAEECCRLTQEWRADNRTGHPNLFNWCPWNQTEDCSYVSEDQLSGFTGVNITLSPGQCELRWQNLAGPLQGAPAILLAKGPDVPFWCGAPIMFEPPPAPKGYQQEVGKGVLLSSRFNCSQSDWDGDCTFQTAFEDGVHFCNDNQRCKEFAIKQGVPLDPLADPLNPDTPYRFFFRGAVDTALQLLVPSSSLYIMQERDLSTDSSGLSTGAIVGIAVGATAAAAAAAGLAWWGLTARRRQRRRSQALALHSKDAAEEGYYPSESVSSGSGEAGSGSSGGKSGQPGLLEPAIEPLLSGASQPGPSISPSHRSPSSGGSGNLPPLQELVQHVAEQDALAAELSGDYAAAAAILGADALPVALRGWAVEAEDIQYLRHASGLPIEIGRGATAHVFKALYRGEVVAAKELDIGPGANSAARKAFLTEVMHLQHLRHPNVVALYGIALTKTKGIVIMELCEGRDLHSALQVTATDSTERLFSWHRRGQRVALEVARALNYLHSRGVVHMDIKSANILLTEGGTAKLADVAFSRHKVNTYFSDTVSVVGTFAWVAPEVLLGNRQISQACDIWSMGVVLWEIITGERPQRGQLRRPRVPEECPLAICDLLLQCLSDDPQDRPTAQQLMAQLGEGQQEPAPVETAASRSPPAQPRAAPAALQQHVPVAGRAVEAIPSPFALAAGPAHKPAPTS